VASYSRIHLLLADEPAEWTEVAAGRLREQPDTYHLTVTARRATVAVTGTAAQLAALTERITAALAEVVATDRLTAEVTS
jgi:hypothetical protein